LANWILKLIRTADVFGHVLVAYKNINIESIEGFNPLFSFDVHISLKLKLSANRIYKKAIRILMASLFKSIIYKIKNLLV